MRVQFNSEAEFLGELSQDKETRTVRDEVVRLAIVTRQTDTLPLVHVSVVAGYFNFNDLVELEYHAGQAMSGHKDESDGFSRARQAIERLHKRVSEMGLFIRAGRFVLS